MTVAFSRGSVFAVRFQMHLSVYSFHFKCLQSGQRFQMYAFSLKTMSVFDRLSVDDSAEKRFKKYVFSIEAAKVSQGLVT